MNYTIKAANKKGAGQTAQDDLSLYCSHLG